MRKLLSAALSLILAGVILAGCAAESKMASEPTETASAEKPEKADKKSAIKNKKKLSDKKPKKDKDKGSAEDYEKIYEPVLQEVLALIENGTDYDYDTDYDLTGVWERVAYPEDDDIKEVIGYSITDVNDDGIPELLIGENAPKEYESPDNIAYIYNGFTCVDGKPVSFLEGWARNRQHYLTNGHFFNYGSGGAANTIYGEWHLGSDGQEVWDDLYFSDEDAATGDIVIFHNTNGSMDRKDSEKADMSEDEFYDLPETYECVSISWTPMGELSGAAGPAPVSEEPGYDGSLEELQRDGYGVFLGAYKDREKCTPLVDKLAEAGYMYEPVVLTTDFSNLNPEPYYVVTVGLFTSEQAAEEVLADVKAAGFTDAYVKYTGEYTGGRYEYTMTDAESIEITDGRIILHDVGVSLPYGLSDTVWMDLVVDENTVFDKTAEMEFFGNYEKGMSPYEWIDHNRKLMKDDPDKYMSYGPALLGVFEVSLDGNRISSYYGSYWWD